MNKNVTKKILNSLCIEGKCTKLIQEESKLSCSEKCKEFWEYLQGYTANEKHTTFKPCQKYDKGEEYA